MEQQGDLPRLCGSSWILALDINLSDLKGGSFPLFFIACMVIGVTAKKTAVARERESSENHNNLVHYISKAWRVSQQGII